MEKKVILEVPGQAKAYAPYSYGCKVKKVDTFIFIAGVVPNDSEGNIVSKGDIVGQTRKTVENLRATVEEAGATFNDVIKLTTFVVADAMKDYLSTSACSEYLSSFPKPSESLVGVACLANEGQLIEIEGIFGI
ncbi:RidA family protein [Thermodesulfobacteriota bacterium]